jgi:hypothetical protein
MRRRGEIDIGCVVGVVTCFCVACLCTAFGGCGGGPATGEDREKARQWQIDAANGRKLNEGLMEDVFRLRQRVDYLEMRENAQKIINKSMIDFGNDAKARLKKLEEVPHKVDGQVEEKIPPQNVPTVPKDSD